MFITSIKCGRYPSSHEEDVIEQLLDVTTASVKKLVIKIDVLDVLKKLLVNVDHPLLSGISILMYKDYIAHSSTILESWPALSYTISSLEISLYDIARVPMDLYPSIPLRKFQFGPAAKLPLIKLSDHGILGLDIDIFF